MELLLIVSSSVESVALDCQEWCRDLTNKVSCNSTERFLGRRGGHDIRRLDQWIVRGMNQTLPSVASQDES